MHWTRPLLGSRTDRLAAAWQRDDARVPTVEPADALVPTPWEAAGVLSAVVLGVMLAVCLVATIAHWCG